MLTQHSGSHRNTYDAKNSKADLHGEEGRKPCRYVVTLPGGIEFDVYARNKGAARQAARDYFGRPHLPRGTRITRRLNH